MSERPWLGVRARLRDAGRSGVEIRVEDRGPGIPADELPHIFDAFFRGRDAISSQIHGTGLGLSLVKRFVEANGGTIAVESQVGVGTAFILTFPATS